MTTAPDGTMYITDIYRGIVQESQWSGPGTYLRQRSTSTRSTRSSATAGSGAFGTTAGRRGDATNRDRPRFRPSSLTSRRRTCTETAAQLVTHLTDPNGWWRDTAQKLIVLKQDKSVVPDPQDDGDDRPTTSSRAFHAMWTLEGLGAARRSARARRQ